MILLDSIFATPLMELNEALRRRFSFKDDRVVASNLTGHGGATGGRLENRILMTMVNLAPQPGAHQTRDPALPLTLDLTVMFVADFSGPLYIEALKILGAVIEFFHLKPAFTLQNTPDLDPTFERLTFELLSLSLDEIGTVFRAHGAPYQPAAFYRLIATPDPSARFEYPSAGPERIVREP